VKAAAPPAAAANSGGVLSEEFLAQVGKSTLADLIAARSVGARELYLDDQAVRAAAEADPSAFVRHDGLLMIDEIQRVPELLLAIRREVDRWDSLPAADTQAA
jgi:predicted AAA+ superfamily ATPase